MPKNGSERVFAKDKPHKKDEFKVLKNPKGEFSIDYSSPKVVKDATFIPVKVSIEGHVEKNLASRFIDLAVNCLVDCDEQINYVVKDKVDNKARVQDFMSHIIEVCRLHGMSISHQDDQGGFIIEKYDDKLVEWFTHASDEYSKKG